MEIATSKRVTKFIEELNLQLRRPEKPYEMIDGKLKKYAGSLILDSLNTGFTVDVLLKSGGQRLIDDPTGRKTPKETLIFLYGIQAGITLLKENFGFVKGWYPTEEI